MISKNLALILATISAVSAAPTKRQDPCQDAYKQCIANGTPEIACSCTLTACVGEDNARNREYCASATASLNLPKPTEIPGGCNPAHPGSCPSSYFTYPVASETETATFTSISGIPGGCNPAHPGSCPTSYFTTVTKPAPTFTSIAGIPGGCNPAHPGSCPSSYFTYPVASETEAKPEPTAQPDAPKPQPETPGSSGYSDPKPVDGKMWQIKDLTRYCGEDNSGCDYNFAIEADGKTERCTVIRMPGSNAATESWSDEPCTDGSNFKVSWGYVTEPAPAYAVITVVDDKEVAWFGVSDVNGQEVTPSNPLGSGQFGDLQKSQVFTY